MTTIILKIRLNIWSAGKSQGKQETCASNAAVLCDVKTTTEEPILMPVTEYLSRFGVLPGNSAIAHGTAFHNAIPTIQADRLSLVVEEGDYNIDAQGPLELGYFQSCLIAAGPRVQFIHKGTGRFFSFNGSAFNPTGGVNK